jgi:hypothetical protein
MWQKSTRDRGLTFCFGVNWVAPMAAVPTGGTAQLAPPSLQYALLVLEAHQTCSRDLIQCLIKMTRSASQPESAQPVRADTKLRSSGAKP